MPSRVRAFFSALFALLFLVCLGALALHRLEYRRGALEYEKAAELAGLRAPPVFHPDSDPPADVRDGAVEPSSTASAMEQNPSEMEGGEPETEGTDIPAEPDLNALRAVNRDVAFWLLIPDTAVSYPVVQGTDNSYYLKHTWTGQRNRVGSVFLDHRCGAALEDFNTLIYGHHMQDGSMFAPLARYEDPSFWEAHPAIYLLTDSVRVRCEIFAAYETELTGCAFRLDFPNGADRQAFLEECLARSVLDTGITPTAQDRILTLCTCTAMGSRQTRWIVQGVLYEEE